jgi:hypothetical protein
VNALKRIIIALVTGFGGMFILWAFAFLLVPKTAAIAYLYPGTALAPVLRVIPSKAVYVLFPSGGLDATAGLCAFFASLFWWVLGAVSAYFMLRRKT